LSNFKTRFGLALVLVQTCECEGLQGTITSLRQQLSDGLDLRKLSPSVSYSQRFAGVKSSLGELGLEKEDNLFTDKNEGPLVQRQVSSCTFNHLF